MTMTVTNIYDENGPFYIELTGPILGLLISLNVFLLFFFIGTCKPSLKDVNIRSVNMHFIYYLVAILHVASLLSAIFIPLFLTIGVYDQIKTPDMNDDSFDDCLDNTLEYILSKDENNEALKYVKTLFEDSKIKDFLKIDDVSAYQKKYTLRELRNSIVLKRYLGAILATAIVLGIFSVFIYLLIINAIPKIVKKAICESEIVTTGT